MMHNVLRSPRFDEIIDEIKALGFAKGVSYINPKTGKRVQRFVDFNQGLDAFQLTPHKAKRLGELAIRLCAENGITHMSNYLLYNGVDFTGKGHSYHTDTPEDLYERMHISMDLQEELIKRTGNKIAIFSFPMRYIPLEDLKRGFVGTHWNPKYLRALQRMLISTQGKGVSSRSFFEADFGRNPEEFVRALAMPESHLGWRGVFLPHKDETAEEAKARKKIWDENQLYLNEWNRLFDRLGDSRAAFISAIGDNNIDTDRFAALKDLTQKKLLIHYFTTTTMLKAFSMTSDTDREIYIDYITNEFPIMYQRLIRHIADGKIPYSLLLGVCQALGERAVSDILSVLDYEAKEVPFAGHNLSKVQAATKKSYFDFELMKCLFLYSRYDAINRREKARIVDSIKCLDERTTRELLLKHFDHFREMVLQKTSDGEAGAEYIIDELNRQLTNVYKQLSIFDIE